MALVTNNKDNCLSRFLDKHYWILTVYGFVFAFICYFCMYAYRKPYTALKYEGQTLWGVDFKTILITVQTIGYTLSKFLGIKYISELSPNNRGKLTIGLITISEIALLFFPIIPAPYSMICLFFNGLPLGLIWGIVYAFLEGRRTSEVLGSGMAVSFIISSGAVKSVGKSLILKGLPELWMPVVVGAIFYPVLLISTYMLVLLPPPNEIDIATRSEHTTMNAKERKQFCKTFGPGIVLMVLFYTFLTGFRDFRDNFAPELWNAILGSEETPQIYTTSEICVAVIVVIPIACLMLLGNNMLGYGLYFVIITLGLLVSGAMTIAYDKGNTSGTVWMVACGVGIYIGYIPFNSILFDRMIAAFRVNANSGFLMYLCDAFGYLASIVVMFIKNFTKGESWLDFAIILSYVITIFGVFDMVGCLLYYTWKYFQGYQYKDGKKPTDPNQQQQGDDECRKSNEMKEIEQPPPTTSEGNNEDKISPSTDKNIIVEDKPPVNENDNNEIENKKDEEIDTDDANKVADVALKTEEEQVVRQEEKEAEAVAQSN